MAKAKDSDSDSVDFDAALQQLKKKTFIKSQKKLSEVLGVSEAAVSQWKASGKLPSHWLERVEKVLAEKNPEINFKELQDKIPPFDGVRFLEREQQKKAKDSYEIFIKSVCDKVLNFSQDAKSIFSDDIAIKKSLFKQYKMEEMTAIRYIGEPFAREIKPNDVLIIRKIENFEGNGHYVLQDFDHISIWYVEKEVSGKLELYRGDDPDKCKTIEKFTDHFQPKAKVIAIFRSLA